MRLLGYFLKDKIGATAVEYGLITALIAVSLIAGAGAVGGNLSNMFNMVTNKVETPAP